jgi:hypothetical protein
MKVDPVTNSSGSENLMKILQGILFVGVSGLVIYTAAVEYFKFFYTRKVEFPGTLFHFQLESREWMFSLFPFLSLFVLLLFSHLQGSLGLSLFFRGSSTMWAFEPVPSIVDRRRCCWTSKRPKTCLWYEDNL